MYTLPFLKTEYNKHTEFTGGILVHLPTLLIGRVHQKNGKPESFPFCSYCSFPDSAIAVAIASSIGVTEAKSLLMMIEKINGLPSLVVAYPDKAETAVNVPVFALTFC